MNVTAALPWWNERPQDLDACVRSLANVADRIVALDGSYSRYPEATAKSSKAEVNAIEKAADAVGMECLVLQPTDLWLGQVEKRSYLLALASVGSDWIVTLDADCVVHADRKATREFLKQTHSDVIEVIYHTPKHPKRSVEESSVGVWHAEQAGNRVSIPHLYRTLPLMRVEKFHWWYSALKDGQRVWLWSSDGNYPHVKHGFLPDYEVEHRALMRTPEQIRLSRGFLNDREMVVRLTGQEDDREGLPEPKYNYERMPA